MKLDRSPTPSTSRSTAGSAPASHAGAAGGKLVGAGGGGFLLFYAEDKAEPARHHGRLGLDEVRFGIDYHGATAIVDE